ncbi:MAG: DUF4097 domain-containing protein [Clostridiales Family XIII bacterium]|jgi:hypothetical protein|nr:DUF4097 domain-containing protein [Clostridiales Family XIII bacterium]
MNKYTKAFIIIATSMIAAGVILSAVGFALGGLRSVHFGSQGFYVDGLPGDLGVSDDFLRDLDGFSDMDIRVGVYTVVLQKGDGYGLRVHGRRFGEAPVVRVEDGLLTLRAGEDSLRAGRSGFFENWLSVFPFGIAYSDWDDVVIEITYPSGARFGDVSIEDSVGSVEIAGLEAASLSVLCSAGSLDIENSALDALRVDLNLGECEIENVRAESAVVAMDAGNFSARDFDCGALNGDFSMGKAEVDGGLLGDVDISTDMGSVFLRTDRPKSEYSVDLNVSLGGATVDGRAVSGVNAGSAIGGADGAPYSIRVEADMGSVEIEFS